MNCRKMLAAFVAVAGLVCANTPFAEAQIGVKAEKESAGWLSKLLAGGSATKSNERIVGREPPECYDQNGKAVYSYKRCEELERGLPPRPPCAARVCDIDGGGP
jgi:hypothetical protein